MERNEGGSLHHHHEASYQRPQLAGPSPLGKRPAMKTCSNMAGDDRVKRGEESIIQDAFHKDCFVAWFHSICEETGLSCTPDVLNNLPWKGKEMHVMF